MSTFSSANITDGNLVLKERTHRIKIKYSMHQYSIRLHNLGNWLIPRHAYQCSSGCCQATDKTILCTPLNHFVSKVVHDKFSSVCEVVANGPRLRIGCLPN